MPKPIKKRVYKKTGPQEDVRSIYEIARQYYSDNRRFVNLLLGLTILALVVIFGGGYYLRKSTEDALYLQYEGLRAFHERANKDALKIAYEKFNTSYNKKKTPYSLLYMAYAAQELGQKDRALKILQGLVNKYARADIQSLAYYKMYEIYLSEKKTPEAMKALDSLLSLEGQYLKDLALFKKGELLEAENKKDEAKKIYERLIKEFPESPFAAKAKDRVDRTQAQKPKNQDNKGQ